MQHFGSKAEALAASIRQRIVRGEFPVGSQLPGEAAMLAEYRISRPTYREAIRVLEAEGLLVVERGAKGGTRVCAPGIEPISRLISLYLQVQGVTVNDLLRHRMLTEPSALYSAILAADEQMLAALRDCVEEQAALLDSVQVDLPTRKITRVFHEFVEIDSRLRAVLFRHTGSAISGLMGQVMEEVLRSHRANYGPVLDAEATPELLDAMREAIEARRTVIALAAECRAEEASDLWRRHLERIERHVEAAGRQELALMPLA